MTIEHPVGAGTMCTPAEVANELSRRRIGLFLDDRNGRRPVHGNSEKFHADPSRHSMVPFYEYFHGRHRRRSGRLPPNGMDRPRGQPHPQRQPRQRRRSGKFIGPYQTMLTRSAVTGRDRSTALRRFLRLA